MRRGLKWLQVGCIAGLAALSLVLTALAVPRLIQAQESAGKRSGVVQYKYTQADWDLAMGCRVEGYQDLSLAEFDRKVADWEDEEAFHRMEEAIERLGWDVDGDTEEGKFLYGTLTASFQECAAKHYGGSCERIGPYYADEGARYRSEDVFGDSYVVFQAEAGYVLGYQVADETRTTVAQRDQLLADYRQEVERFLAGKTEKELMDEEAMKKALKAELKRLDAALDSPEIALTGTELSYYWADGPEG